MMNQKKLVHRISLVYNSIPLLHIQNNIITFKMLPLKKITKGYCRCWWMVLCLLYLQGVSAAFAVVSSHTRSQRARLYRHSMELKMGMLDNLKKVGSFLQDRQNDFVKLDPDDNYVFGPGPAMLLIDCPSGISSSEIMDMVEDGAPVASKCGVSIRRIDSSEEASTSDKELLDRTVQDVLKLVIEDNEKVNLSETDFSIESDDDIVLKSYSAVVPVLYFSGISNREMMNTYRIIAREIYEETGGLANAACAKFVGPASTKPLQQIIEEITGDHLDAVSMRE